MSLLRAKSDLTAAILETKEFFNLKSAKNILEQSPEHKNQVTEFQKKWQILNEARSKGEDVSKAAAELNNEYARLSQTPEISKYLQASGSMNALLDKLFEDIHETIDTNLR